MFFKYLPSSSFHCFGFFDHNELVSATGTLVRNGKEIPSKAIRQKGDFTVREKSKIRDNACGGCSETKGFWLGK